MQPLPSRMHRTGPVRRYLILVLLIVFGYLCQVCVMPYIRIFGVTPNLLYVVVGIVTVAPGVKKFGLRYRIHLNEYIARCVFENPSPEIVLRFRVRD